MGTPEKPLVVPDSIEPYLGYKSLHVNGNELHSMAYLMVWPHGSRAEAFCGAGGNHECPGLLCPCGIYAANVGEAWRYFDPGSRVIVEVALWGRVTMGTTGARGQFAYPQKIVAAALPDRVIQGLAEAYQIPIEMLVESDPSLIRAWSEIETRQAFRKALTQARVEQLLRFSED